MHSTDGDSHSPLESYPLSPETTRVDIGTISPEVALRTVDMSQFIGLHMRVVLRDPAGHLLTGTVSDVQAGISLTLTNGKRVSLSLSLLSLAFTPYAAASRIPSEHETKPLNYSIPHRDARVDPSHSNRRLQHRRPV